MARPLKMPRALASRALIASPAQVSHPASVSVPTSCHLAACLTTQKRLISQQTPHPPLWDPRNVYVPSNTQEATAGSASHQEKWNIKEDGGEMLTGNTVTLTHHESTRPKALDRHWLRDGCECTACVDPHSGQKNFGTTDVPLDLPISSCRKTKEGTLEIVWQNDFLTGGRENHTSTYSAERVESFFSKPKKAGFPPVVLWDKKTIQRDLLFVEYNDWMTNEETLGAGVRMLHSHGIFFIRNAPHSEESVVSMASRIGNLKETLYGRTWDVRSKPEAENVAYTSAFLGLHQDMMYLKDPPRLQLLHCLENSCEGGESLFSDASVAAFLMKIGPPELREALGKQMVAYHYKKHGHFYENHHPVIDDSDHVRWSPPFQAPLLNLIKNEEGCHHYRQWVTAAVKFQQLLEKEEFLFQYKMKPGDCVVFDNLRVMHGRRAFDTSAGSRWLKGTYNAHDVFMSRLNTVCANRPVPPSWTMASMVGQAVRLNGMYKIWDKTNVAEPRTFRQIRSGGRNKSR